VSQSSQTSPSPSSPSSPFEVSQPSFLQPDSTQRRRPQRVDPPPSSSAHPSPSGPPSPTELGDAAGAPVEDRPSSGEGFTPASTEPTTKALPEPARADVAAFHGLIVVGLGLVGIIAASRLCRSEAEAEAGCWRIDDEDEDAIGTPLARIAARHAPGSGPAGDTGDVVAAVVGVAGYALKNTDRVRLVRADPWTAQDAAEDRPADPPNPPSPSSGPGLIPPPGR
jgi:hypothetical protein